MAPEDEAQAREHDLEGWGTPLPQKIPSPTYAPAFLALGITFLFFGVLSSYVFSAAGLVVMIVSISKWVGEWLDGE
jgi:hypothetical protein